MSIQITLNLTNEQSRRIKYFLGERYGKRKGIKRLIKDAAFEIVREEAKKRT